MAPSTPKPRVLLTGEIDFAQQEWNALSDVATLEVSLAGFLALFTNKTARTTNAQVADSVDRQEFIKDLHGKYKGVIAISRTFPSTAVR